MYLIQCIKIMSLIFCILFLLLVLLLVVIAWCQTLMHDAMELDDQWHIKQLPPTRKDSNEKH